MITVTFIAGLPGSGKTTTRNNCFSGVPVASSDDYIEARAADMGSTYGKVFKSEIKNAERHMWACIESFISMGKSFVVDRTSLSEKSRRSAMTRISQIARDYNRDVEFQIIFIDTPIIECMKRNEQRDAGRRIPAEVYEFMIKSLERPAVHEGFENIYVIRGDHVEHSFGSKRYDFC